MKVKFFSLFVVCFLGIVGGCFGGDFVKYFPTYLKFEGSGIHYDDETISKYGVTIETLRAYYIETKNPKFDKDSNKRINYKDVALLVPSDAYEIIKKKYWDFWRSDSVTVQLTAEVLTDMYVNMGAGYDKRHVKFVQKWSGVYPDAVVGVRTLRAINQQPQKQFVVLLCDYRINFYHRLAVKDARKKKFLKGWTKRVNYFKSKSNLL